MTIQKEFTDENYIPKLGEERSRLIVRVRDNGDIGGGVFLCIEQDGEMGAATLTPEQATELGTWLIARAAVLMDERERYK